MGMSIKIVFKKEYKDDIFENYQFLEQKFKDDSKISFYFYEDHIEAYLSGYLDSFNYYFILGFFQELALRYSEFCYLKFKCVYIDDEMLLFYSKKTTRFIPKSINIKDVYSFANRFQTRNEPINENEISLLFTENNYCFFSVKKLIKKELINLFYKKKGLI